MQDLWSYETQKRFDQNGNRWHFVTRHCFASEGLDEPYEIYFRDDNRTEFGMLGFERRQENPYRDHVTLVNKIMNNKEFREYLLDAETEGIWRKSWK